MQFQTQVTVTGAKAYDNTIDGTHHNFTKVYVMTELKDGAGSATVEYKWGTSDNFQKIAKAVYPFNATATMEIVTNGSKTSTQLLDLQPVKAKE